jgi:hypothetical protein
MRAFYKDWELFNEAPEGYYKKPATGSPLYGYERYCNGSPLKGGKSILVRTIDKPNLVLVEQKELKFKEPKQTTLFEMPKEYAKTINTLARKRMEERLLNDIRCDLMICELENWDKKEYIKELQKIIGEIKL